MILQIINLLIFYNQNNMVLFSTCLRLHTSCLTNTTHSIINIMIETYISSKHTVPIFGCLPNSLWGCRARCACACGFQCGCLAQMSSLRCVCLSTLRLRPHFANAAITVRKEARSFTHAPPSAIVRMKEEKLCHSDS